VRTLLDALKAKKTNEALTVEILSCSRDNHTKLYKGELRDRILTLEYSSLYNFKAGDQISIRGELILDAGGKPIVYINRTAKITKHVIKRSLTSDKSLFEFEIKGTTA
jgi:hypothetical protein